LLLLLLLLLLLPLQLLLLLPWDWLATNSRGLLMLLRLARLAQPG
jgi:hypothetical protein